MSGQKEYLKDILHRYESEEDEFVRELEQMQQSIREEERVGSSRDTRETDSESDIPQDPQPILSVLCSLVDEIGSLRTENRRLKTRLALPNPRKNMVQRVSAILDASGFSLPKLRRPPHSEIRVGARERLSTPPRKDPLTTSSISTDFSSDFSHRKGYQRKPPIVQPENSDSDMEEDTAFDEIMSPDISHRARSCVRRRDMSLSECTSPSSASSRDPSETIASSRSSFLELIGLKKRREQITSVTELLHPPPKSIVKKRKRRISAGDSSSSGAFMNMDNNARNEERQRQMLKNRRSARFPNEESDDEYANKRKSTSFLSVNHGRNKIDGSAACILRVDRETRLRHEKDTLMAESEELKMRNTRLVEQLREKSSVFSKVQQELKEAESEMQILQRKCSLNDAIDRLTLNERIIDGQTKTIDKVEERLRKFESDLQTLKVDASNTHKSNMHATVQEKAAYHNCLEQLEKLQRENFGLIQTQLGDTEMDDTVLKRKLDMMPSYDALYSFTMGIVRKLTELRWSLLDKTTEMNKTEMELISTQSALLIAHAQIERLRLQLQVHGRKEKRPASYHGENYIDTMVKQEMSFFLPFKLQSSRVENMRRVSRKQICVETGDRQIEHEFLKLFGYAKSLAQICEKTPSRPVSRIETMMREMNSPAVLRHRQRLKEIGKEKETQRRPISLVETEERRIRRLEEHRRSTRIPNKNAKSPEQRFPDSREVRPVVTSLQDVSHQMNSPLTTPIAVRKNTGNTNVQGRNSAKLSPNFCHEEDRRERRLLKQRSIDNDVLRHSTLRRQISTDRPPVDRTSHHFDGRNTAASIRPPEKRYTERVLSDRTISERQEEASESTEVPDPPPEPSRVGYGSSGVNEERGERPTKCRIQRSYPVQSRMRPPTSFYTKSKTLEPLHPACPTPLSAAEIQRKRDKSATVDNRTGYLLTHPPPQRTFDPHRDDGSKLPKPEKRTWLEKLKQMKK